MLCFLVFSPRKHPAQRRRFCPGNSSGKAFGRGMLTDSLIPGSLTGIIHFPKPNLSLAVAWASAHPHFRNRSTSAAQCQKTVSQHERNQRFHVPPRHSGGQFKRPCLTASRRGRRNSASPALLHQPPQIRLPLRRECDLHSAAAKMSLTVAAEFFRAGLNTVTCSTLSPGCQSRAFSGRRETGRNTQTCSSSVFRFGDVHDRAS